MGASKALARISDALARIRAPWCWVLHRDTGPALTNLQPGEKLEAVTVLSKRREEG